MLGKQIPRVLIWTVFLSIGCVQEVDHSSVVTLPPESYLYERFIDASVTFTADRITVEALRAYRKDCVVVVDKERHSREVGVSRIVLKNLDSGDPRNPVSLMFRNMRIKARERIDVVFSDLPLRRNDPSPVILLFVGDGVAHLRGDGVDLTASRIVIRNDEVRGFLKDGSRMSGSVR